MKPSQLRSWFNSRALAFTIIVLVCLQANSIHASTATKKPSSETGREPTKLRQITAIARPISNEGIAEIGKIESTKHSNVKLPRQEAYGYFQSTDLRSRYVPKHLRIAQKASQRNGPVTKSSRRRIMPIVAERSIVAGDEFTESENANVPDGDMNEDGPITIWAESSGDCSGDCGVVGCASCCWSPFPCFNMDNLSVFAGVHGFKNSSNLGRDGSFGFHQGLNWGAPMQWLMPYSGLGMQLGLRATQANLSGADFTTDTRNQLFVTAGFFRRSDWGLQGGLVVDYLNDDWYDQVELTQVRGEISWMYPCRNEWGFMYATRGDDDTTVSPITANQTDRWGATNLYALFFRRRFEQIPGGEGRFYAGGTGNSSGLIGLDARIPMNDCWSFESTFTYVIPEDSGQNDDDEREGWNVGFSIVWHPHRTARPLGDSKYYRPLFNVADNGTLIQRRR